MQQASLARLFPFLLCAVAVASGKHVCGALQLTGCVCVCVCAAAGAGADEVDIPAYLADGAVFDLTCLADRAKLRAMPPRQSSRWMGGVL